MLKKLFVALACVQFVTPTFGVIGTQIGGKLDVSTPCDKYGLTEGGKCDISLDTVTVCSRVPCGAVNCYTTKTCICAPDSSYCPTGGGDTGCTKTCPTDLEWHSVTGKTYQVQTNYRLDKISCTCNEIMAYRCAPGYYSNGLTVAGQIPDCVACPKPTDRVSGGKLGNGETSPAGATSVTACYIPKATGNLLWDIHLTDESGTYSFTDDCHYGN